MNRGKAREDWFRRQTENWDIFLYEKIKSRLRRLQVLQYVLQSEPSTRLELSQ